MSAARARWLPALAAASLVLAFAGDRLTALDQPLDTDALTQRVLTATLPLGDLVAGTCAPRLDTPQLRLWWCPRQRSWPYGGLSGLPAKDGPGDQGRQSRGSAP